MKIRRFGVTKCLAKTADFRSYQDAHVLVDWLNEAPRARDRKRAIRLIDTLRAVNGLPLSDSVSVGHQLDEIAAYCNFSASETPLLPGEPQIVEAL
jgi:hypothetical protein